MSTKSAVMGSAYFYLYDQTKASLMGSTFFYLQDKTRKSIMGSALCYRILSTFTCDEETEAGHSPKDAVNTFKWKDPFKWNGN